MLCNIPRVKWIKKEKKKSALHCLRLTVSLILRKEENWLNSKCPDCVAPTTIFYQIKFMFERLKFAFQIIKFTLPERIKFKFEIIKFTFERIKFTLERIKFTFETVKFTFETIKFTYERSGVHLKKSSLHLEQSRLITFHCKNQVYFQRTKITFQWVQLMLRLKYSSFISKNQVDVIICWGSWDFVTNAYFPAYRIQPNLIQIESLYWNVINNVIIHLRYFTGEPLLRSDADISIFILQTFISRKFKWRWFYYSHKSPRWI